LSDRLVRLPLYYGMKDDEVYLVTEHISNFFKG